MVESFLSLRSVFDDRQGKAPRKRTVAAPAGVLNDALPDPVMGYRRQFPNVGLPPHRKTIARSFGGTSGRTSRHRHHRNDSRR